MGTTARRLIRQIKNDRRSLGMMFISPLVIMTLLYLLMGEPRIDIKIGVVGHVAPSTATALQQAGTVTHEGAGLDIDRSLDDGIYDAVVVVDNRGTSIHLLQENTAYENKIRSALVSAQQQPPTTESISTFYLHGTSLDTAFKRLAHTLLGIMSFFLTFIVAGIWFVRERTQGTLERMILTPITRLQVAMGYVLGIGLFSVVQAVLLLFFTRYALDVQFIGGWNFALALLIMVMQVVVAVEIGVFASIFANTEFQVAQFIPVVVIPQVFFSGIIPVETMPWGFDKVALVMPMYHSCSGLQRTLVYGQGLGSTWINLLVLLGMQLVLMIANALLLKRYRAL